MLRSMTGFGRSNLALNGVNISVEVKSINSKLLDLNLRVPASFKEREMELRKLLSAALVRGKIEAVFNYENEGTGEQQYQINKGQAKNYFHSIVELSEELKIANQDILSSLLRMPEVVTVSEQALGEQEWETVKSVLTKALEQTNSFRIQEGQTLAADFNERVKTILRKLQRVGEMEPKRAEMVREKILQHLADFLDNEKTDKNRFEQEMIYYVEKQDITEEMVRLKNHCDYFLETTARDETINGKKLNFIAQEIGREINTIGSKAGDAAIQRVVVEMKDELEKIKEQLWNVL